MRDVTALAAHAESVSVIRIIFVTMSLPLWLTWSPLMAGSKFCGCSMTADVLLIMEGCLLLPRVERLHSRLTL